MDVTDTISLEVSDLSFVATARRQVGAFARAHGMSEKIQDRLDLVCSELCTNLIKHTPKGGQILVQGLIAPSGRGMEMFAIDSGHGMNVDTCMADGFSTSGTLGTGLGAVKRMSDEFEIHALPGKGTTVQTRFWENAVPENGKFCYGGVSVPKPGESLSGDKWAIVAQQDSVYCLLVDGLGHGIEASEAAQLAVRRFKENLNDSPRTSDIMRILHKSLRGSRGAVGAVAKIQPAKHCIDYCGLGNIAGIVQYPTERKHLVSMNGTVGYEASKFMEFKLTWNSDSILVMHSDGFSSKTFDSLPDVGDRGAPLIAGWLYQHHAKAIDDATVLVLKHCVQNRGKDGRH